MTKPTQHSSRTIQVKGGGSIEFRDNKNLICLSEDASTSGLLQLLAMEFLNQLLYWAAEGPDEMKEDAKTVTKWLGITIEPNCALPKVAYERFARGFETFVMEGHDNLGKPQVAFDNFRRELKSTYHIGDTFHPPISNDIRGVFRRMFGVPDDAPRSELLFWADGEGSGIRRWAGEGATIRLDSGEICLLSFAWSGVRVKRKKSLNFFPRGQVLFEEKEPSAIWNAALTLDKKFPVLTVPLNTGHFLLRAFANAIWNCPNCDVVSAVLSAARSGTNDREKT